MAHIKSDTKAYIIETTHNLTLDKDRCLSFWYYEDGESEFTLSVYQSEDTFERQLTSYKSQLESRKKWTLMKLNVEMSTYSYNAGKGKFKLEMFEIHINNLFFSAVNLKIVYNQPGKGDIDFIKFAIDDIQIRPELCSHQSDFVYNFENGYDDLDMEKLQPLRSYAVSINRPSYNPNNNYPSVDHTTGTDSGKYFLFTPKARILKSNYYQNTLSIMNLKSDMNGPKCVRFAYQMTSNITFKAFTISEYQYNYDYAHKNSSKIWESL